MRSALHDIVLGMKKVHTIFLVFALLILSGLVLFLYIHSTYKKSTGAYHHAKVEIEGKILDVEIADTPSSRERGLSYRPALAPTTGMLFIFDRDAFQSFWMKGMNFSLDMFWINSDSKIVFIKEDASPSSYPDSFIPLSPARYVLETVAGFARDNTINVGDSVKISGLK